LLSAAVDDDRNYSFEVLSEKISDKDKMLIYNRRVEVLDDVIIDKALSSILDAGLIKKIGNYSKRAEEYFNHPVYLTWTHEKDVSVVGINTVEDGLTEKPTWKLSKLSALTGEVPSTVGNSIVTDCIQDEFFKFADRAGKSGALLTNTTKEIFGRIYYNLSISELLYEVLQVPETTLKRYIANQSIYQIKDALNEGERLFDFDLTNIIVINKWIKGLYDDLSDKVMKTRYFNKEMKAFPFSKADKKTLGILLSRIFDNIKSLNSLVSIPGAILLCLVMLAKFDGIRNKCEFYELLPDCSLEFDRSYINQFINSMVIE
jgi:hypothetical protein